MEERRRRAERALGEAAAQGAAGSGRSGGAGRRVTRGEGGKEEGAPPLRGEAVQGGLHSEEDRRGRGSGGGCAERCCR